MSRNAFEQCAREYNERVAQREHAAMERAQLTQLQPKPQTMTLSELLFDLEVLLEQVIRLNFENQDLRRRVAELEGGKT